MSLTFADAIQTHIQGNLDLLGELVAAPRLPGEEDADYRDRLATVFVHPSNASYRGLLALLCRATGITPHTVIRITYTGEDVPWIEIMHQQLTLKEGETVKQWCLRSDEAFTLAQLTNLINTTTHFSATLLDPSFADARSAGLIWTHNYATVTSEKVPGSRRFRLRHAPVVPQSLIFSETEHFAIAVNDTPAAPGEFKVDLKTGKVTCHSLPSGTGKVSYQYYYTTINLEHTPICLADLNSDVARSWWFNTCKLPTGIQQPLQPHPWLQRVYQELLQKCPVQWG